MRLVIRRLPAAFIGLSAGWALPYFVPIWVHAAAELLVGAPL